MLEYHWQSDIEIRQALLQKKHLIHLKVNGQGHRLRVDAGETLLSVLRERLRLTGTKHGCGTGQCGACTVLLEGEPVDACLVLAVRADGRSVTTIEGLASGGELHPLQQAFLDHGAVQCGFCSPGLILAAKALLDRNPRPGRQEIQEALSGNLCRCTGYGPIIDAVEAVASGERPAGPIPPRLDAPDKVTGATRYAGDLFFSGMLHGRTLRSTTPHASITAINTARARRTKVPAILTAQDIKGSPKYGPGGEQWALVPAGEPVRMVGEPLALVAAKSAAEAQAAIDLIEVEYEALTVVSTVQEALNASAPILQPGRDGNICVRMAQGNGDETLAPKAGTTVVERSYDTPIQEHAFLEPEVAVAVPESDGSLTVYCATQSPFPVRKSVAQIVGLPEERVRIVATTAGGAFGGKADLSLQAHAALLALHTGKPVRMEWTREESILSHPKRHPLHLHGSLAASSDGNLDSLYASVVGDAGPYTGNSPLALLLTLSSMTGPYRVPNWRAAGLMALTNNPNGGLLRGMGGLHANTLRESLVDLMSRRLGLDPIEVRRQNFLQDGMSPGFPGMVLDGRVTMHEALDRALEAARTLSAPSASSKATGRGICCAMAPFQIAAPPRSATARIEAEEDGLLTVHAGVSELGNGVTTTLAQMVAGEMGIPPEQVRVVFGDTGTCPVGTPAVGSGQTYTSGNALRQAAVALKLRLQDAASRMLEAPPDILHFEGGKIYISEAPHRSVSLGQAARECSQNGLEPVAEVTFSANHAGWGHSFATTIADVEVDLETGDVQVLGVVSALDTGPVINRHNVLGQMLGGAVQALGFTTMEEVKVEGSIPRTRGLEEYRIPTAMDMPPEFTALTLEEPYPTGPYGARGIGEHGIYAVGPAILCAIENAVGVMLDGFPATPERILRARREDYRRL